MLSVEICYDSRMDFSVRDIACMLTYYILDNPFFKRIANDVKYMDDLDDGIEEFVLRAIALLIDSGCVSMISLAEKLKPYAKFLSNK